MPSSSVLISSSVNNSCSLIFYVWSSYFHLSLPPGRPAPLRPYFAESPWCALGAWMAHVGDKICFSHVRPHLKACKLHSPRASALGLLLVHIHCHYSSHIWCRKIHIAAGVRARGGGKQNTPCQTFCRIVSEGLIIQ